MATYADLQEYVLKAPDSGTANIDALLASGGGWAFATPVYANTLYYSFAVDAGTESGASELTAFNAAQQDAVREILAHVTDVTGIRFAETADGLAADLHFASTDVAGAGTVGYSNHAYDYALDAAGHIDRFVQDAYVYLDNAEFRADNLAPTPGSLGYHVLLHEIGHALGLKHPFESAATEPETLDSALDNSGNTVMSYTLTGGYKSTFQSLDVAALQFLYGGDGLIGENYGVANFALTRADEEIAGTAGKDRLNGTTGDDVLIGGAGGDKLRGGGGADTFVFVDLPGSKAGADKVLDFATDDGDRLVFDIAAYPALAAGIGSANFVLAAAPKSLDENDYLLVSSKSGKLYFDPDGSGAAAAVLVATLKGNLAALDYTSCGIELLAD